MAIKPTNRMAQMMHRSVGSPASALPDTAISNCFPDWTSTSRGSGGAFVGIVLQESDNYVVDVELPRSSRTSSSTGFCRSTGAKCFRVFGPVIPGGSDDALSVAPGDDFRHDGVVEFARFCHATPGRNRGLRFHGVEER